MNYRNCLNCFASVLVLLALSSCTSDPNSFPQIANPPPFDYADGEELRSNMHRLAFELQRLDMSLATDFDERPDFQREVIRSIQNIERIAGILQSGDLQTKHPFLLDDMDRFLGDLQRARTDATRDRPRYYMAGRISGGCISCHRENR